MPAYSPFWQGRLKINSEQLVIFSCARRSSNGRRSRPRILGTLCQTAVKQLSTLWSALTSSLVLNKLLTNSTGTSKVSLVNGAPLAILLSCLTCLLLLLSKCPRNLSQCWGNIFASAKYKWKETSSRWLYTQRTLEAVAKFLSQYLYILFCESVKQGCLPKD